MKRRLLLFLVSFAADCSRQEWEQVSGRNTRKEKKIMNRQNRFMSAERRKYLKVSQDEEERQKENRKR